MIVINPFRTNSHFFQGKKVVTIWASVTIWGVTIMSADSNIFSDIFDFLSESISYQWFPLITCCDLRFRLYSSVGDFFFRKFVETDKFRVLT